MRRTLKLRTKISLYFLTLMAAWSVFTYVALEFLLTRTARRFYAEQGAQLTRALLLESAPLVDYEDVSGVADLVKRQMKSRPDVRYIVVQDRDGRPIYSSFERGIPQDLLAVRHERAAGEDVSVRLLRAGEELINDYEGARGAARVRVGLSLAPVQDFILTTATAMLWLGAAGLLAVFAVAVHISRPVEALTQAIERAVELDHRTGGGPVLDGTRETSAIARRFEEVMSRLEERTRQLDASKKMAYLGELSTAIAHEVNNPLGVVVLNSDFLARRAETGRLPPDASQEALRIRLAARRATLAVQKLLQFARYSSRTAEPRRRPVRLDALVRETLDLLQDRIQLAGLAVRVDLPGDLPLLHCDEQGLQQVLFNLLTNALDATPQGGEIVIRACADRGRFVLQVVDRGWGMSEDTLRRAKEPFFTTKEAGRGTGLGLAISDSIVRTHGGELLLESRPGGGTTVTIRFPLPDQGSDGEQRPEPAAAATQRS